MIMETPIQFQHSLASSSNEILQKIDAFAQLEKGWDYGDGDAFKRDTIVVAKKMAAFIEAHGINADASPCSNGEIQVIAYLQNSRAEFTVFNSKNISLLFENGNEVIDEREHLSLSEAELQVTFLFSQKK
jgi:hypothetical protein